MAMDDGSYSEEFLNKKVKDVIKTGIQEDGSYAKSTIDVTGDLPRLYKKQNSLNVLTTKNKSFINEIKRGYNMRPRSEIDYFNERYRFGVFDPYNSIGGAKEFLFFTKPDLMIMQVDDDTGVGSSSVLNEGLQSSPYFRDLLERYPNVIRCLQNSFGSVTGNVNQPFNHLLENMCKSNLTVPSLEAEMIDTATNMHGVNFTYRGSSEASDDSFEFSLEFRDTRYLHLYHFFRAYEEYETIKHHGLITPYVGYIEDHILHDQFSIFKFIVDEDYETILYYGKFTGVVPKSLPRDVFTNDTFDEGLSYSIDFKASFYEDMNPNILVEFNYLNYNMYNSQTYGKYRVDIYNEVLDRMDNRACRSAMVEVVTSNSSSGKSGVTYAPGGKLYKLRWRGSDKY